MDRKTYFCKQCGMRHATTECCNEPECIDTWNCARCGVVACDCCGTGGLCADCDIAIWDLEDWPT